MEIEIPECEALRFGDYYGDNGWVRALFLGQYHEPVLVADDQKATTFEQDVIARLRFLLQAVRVP